jgi:DNA-binding NarL/FixJ family response regulator
MVTQNKTRVVIIDDHPLVVAGAQALIDAASDVVCVGVANTGVDGLNLVKETDPDVIVLDVSLPDTNGIMLAKEIIDSGHRGHIVMMTLFKERSYVEQAMKLGVKGFVQKRSSEQNLLLAIRTAMLGGLYLDPATALNMSSEEAGDTGSKPDDTLTNREKEILKMVALGFSNKEIAHKAAISVKSVETYKARALDKLNLYSRAQIVKFALDNGWLISSPKQ